MTVTTTPAAAHSASGSVLDGLASLRLPVDLRLTPAQFELVFAANRDAVLELSADGLLIVMTPTGSETISRNSELVFQLHRFARASGAWKVFESSGGFLLPDGSVYSPDASLLRLERWQELAPEQRQSFAPLCPDLVVVLASPFDEGPRGLSALRQRMAAYQTNGARLGWLLIPCEQAVEVWPAAGLPQRLEACDRLQAGPDFPGLQLELDRIWVIEGWDPQVAVASHRCPPCLTSLSFLRADA
jgi:Uma2 family endonuclease